MEYFALTGSRGRPDCLLRQTKQYETATCSVEQYTASKGSVFVTKFAISMILIGSTGQKDFCSAKIAVEHASSAAPKADIRELTIVAVLIYLFKN